MTGNTNVGLFNDHVKEYEEWFRKYPHAFRSEVAAIKSLLPKGRNLRGVEIGVGTGKFAKALGIREGVEPADKMRALAEKRGIVTLRAFAEQLPYRSGIFDFVVINFSVCYFTSVANAFAEAYRILKKGGTIILGFVDKNGIIGKEYQKKGHKSVFYQNATFYSVTQIERALKRAGFRTLDFSQTLFSSVDRITELEKPEKGYGKGSYVLIRAIK